MTPGRVIVALWVAWALSWWGSAWWSSKTEKQAGIRRELPYRVVMHLGVLAFAIPAHRYEG